MHVHEFPALLTSRGVQTLSTLPRTANAQGEAYSRLLQGPQCLPAHRLCHARVPPSLHASEAGRRRVVQACWWHGNVQASIEGQKSHQHQPHHQHWGQAGLHLSDFTYSTVQASNRSKQPHIPA